LFALKAGSWSHPRRLAVKCEVSALGVNLRFVVTNRVGTPKQIFDWYNQWGQAENFIKELKNDLAADRLSCSAYRANAVRLQLHSLQSPGVVSPPGAELHHARPRHRPATALAPVQAWRPGAALGPPPVVSAIM
jgi:hypothetical protein